MFKKILAMVLALAVIATAVPAKTVSAKTLSVGATGSTVDVDKVKSIKTGTTTVKFGGKADYNVYSYFKFTATKTKKYSFDFSNAKYKPFNKKDYDSYNKSIYHAYVTAHSQGSGFFLDNEKMAGATYGTNGINLLDSRAKKCIRKEFDQYTSLYPTKASRDKACNERLKTWKKNYGYVSAQTLSKKMKKGDTLIFCIQISKASTMKKATGSMKVKIK